MSASHGVMDEHSHDPLRQALSIIFQNLESDLMNQDRREAEARRDLIASAFARAEIAVGQMHTACSDMPEPTCRVGIEMLGRNVPEPDYKEGNEHVLAVPSFDEPSAALGPSAARHALREKAGSFSSCSQDKKHSFNSCSADNALEVGPSAPESNLIEPPTSFKPTMLTGRKPVRMIHQTRMPDPIAPDADLVGDNPLGVPAVSRVSKIMDNDDEPSVGFALGDSRPSEHEVVDLDFPTTAASRDPAPQGGVEIETSARSRSSSPKMRSLESQRCVRTRSDFEMTLDESEETDVDKHFAFLPLWKPVISQVDGLMRSLSADFVSVNSEDSDGSSSCSPGSPSSRTSMTHQISGKTPGCRSSETSMYISSESEYRSLARMIQYLMIKPTGIRCIVWDTFKSVTVLYDLIFIPLSLAFRLPELAGFKIIDAIVGCLWILDIGVSFLRGYIDEQCGVVEMRAGRVALRYIRTWFFFDVFVVTVDIILQITVERTVSLPGVVSLLPLLRLVRVMKLPSLLNMISELLGLKANTEKWAFVLRIVRCLLIFLVINHFVSCGWYAIGQLGHGDGTEISGWRSWTDKHFDSADYTHYRYITSFHWSLTQFTPASMEVTPSNFMERLYNICIIVCSMVTFSSFVSIMTQSITHLQKVRMAEKHAMRQLRHFVAEKNLSLETVAKIMSVLSDDKKAVKKRKIREADIEALVLLPHRLRRQIRVEMYHPILSSHPLLESMSDRNVACFEGLCIDALSETSVSRGEALFTFGTNASGMYFLLEGTLQYYLGLDRRVDDILTCQGGGKPRMCEAALWVHWTHRGRIVAEEMSEVVLLQSFVFTRVCARSLILEELRSYAMMFAKLALCLNGEGAFVKDTWGSDRIVAKLADSAFDADVVHPMACLFVGTTYPLVCFHGWKELVFHHNRKKNPFTYHGSDVEMLFRAGVRSLTRLLPQIDSGSTFMSDRSSASVSNDNLCGQ